MTLIKFLSDKMLCMELVFNFFVIFKLFLKLDYGLTCDSALKVTIIKDLHNKTLNSCVYNHFYEFLFYNNKK